MADKELFIPTRTTVATPPPGGKKKKPKLTADQNIYLAKKQVSTFSLNLVSLVLIQASYCVVSVHCQVVTLLLS